jgi:hypothetical protein
MMKRLRHYLVVIRTDNFCGFWSLWWFCIAPLCKTERNPDTPLYFIYYGKSRWCYYDFRVIHLVVEIWEVKLVLDHWSGALLLLLLILSCWQLRSSFLAALFLLAWFACWLQSVVMVTMMLWLGLSSDVLNSFLGFLAVDVQVSEMEIMCAVSFSLQWFCVWCLLLWRWQHTTACCVCAAWVGTPLLVQNVKLPSFHL